VPDVCVRAAANGRLRRFAQGARRLCDALREAARRAVSGTPIADHGVPHCALLQTEPRETTSGASAQRIFPTSLRRQTMQDVNRGVSSDRIVGGTQSYWDNEGPGPRIMAADTLEGDKVVNSAGEDLGEIKDIMLDVPSGRVAYAVLSFGGILGMGDKLFAIPWQALKLDPENHRFILDADKETLENAPGFDKDHWPSMADQSWATDIHSYYHSRPYWE
jgi:sporulation protein YlmC with PRC-barrel domain